MKYFLKIKLLFFSLTETKCQAMKREFIKNEYKVVYRISSKYIS